MKYLSILTVALFTALPTYASYACFVEPIQTSASSYQMFSAKYHPEALQCSTKKNLGVGLKAISFTLQGGALYLACTGAGTPAALWVQGGSLGVTLVDMVVGELPCDDNDSDKRIRELAKQATCETLAANGIECVMK